MKFEISGDLSKSIHHRRRRRRHCEFPRLTAHLNLLFGTLCACALIKYIEIGKKKVQSDKAACE